ncbi:MAG: UDP-N-acetylmuramoyl-L-alanyl-D-glutamate--2,6-diaminopimelate ligase [Planktomarina sp.]
MTTKTLADLGLNGDADVAITGLSVDSRTVEPGYLFAAFPGSTVHGASFAAKAIALGASAILTDPDGARMIADMQGDHSAAQVVVTQDPRQALAFAAALWFDGQPKTAVAVTGTNGKTSISTFCRQIWLEMGHKAVNLGTTGVEGAWSAPLAHTTPEPITLHRTLAAAAKAGVTHVAMEASSHGLDQKRLDGVQIKVAGFSNFTQDHLDYHETFAAYFAAKMGLFTRVLAPGGRAVVNIDDPKGAEVAQIAQKAGHDVWTVGRTPGVDFHITAQRFEAAGQTLRVEHAGRAYMVQLPLVGGFQGDNVILAAAMVAAAGEDVPDVMDALCAIKPVRGRMELAATRENGAAVYVDYAHTPDAVETAIKALRPHTMGQLHAIIGAGGDRDAGKRALMGQAAAQHADQVFVTDDNPRTEDPAAIRAAVMEGAPNATEIPDRAEAILHAVHALQPGDTLLIAGKGHETGQIIGQDVLPFDDVEQASIAVQALDGGLA